MSALKTKFGPGWLATTLLGVANGVASLDATGKIPVAQLPASVTGGLTFKGTFDASTGSFPASPANGDFYVVSVAGTISSYVLKVGDYIFYSSSLSTWEQIHDPANTDAITEGATNLYFTNTRAQTAAVVNSLGGTQTNQAPSVASVNSALLAKQAAFSRSKESFTLASGDITNGYIILSQLALSNSMTAGVQGLGLIQESPDGTAGDYKLATDVGTGHSKLTWLNDLATGGTTPLAAGDIIYVKYEY
jgi:hypothetical protein